MICIKHIRLEGVRGFRGSNGLNLDLCAASGKPRMRTLIIGKNGTLKSTLLRCIVIGLCDSYDGNSLISEPIGWLIAEGEKEATIEIKFEPGGSQKDSFTVKTILRKKGRKEIVYSSNRDNAPPAVQNLFVCGIGAGRSTEGPDRFRTYRIVDSAYSLFQYEDQMIDTELTLRRLKDFLGTRLYEYTMKAIKKTLGLGHRDKIELPEGGGIVVSGPFTGKDVPLSGWADGYRMTFNWLMHLYAHAMRARSVTSSGGIRGILLIDELEQHLHPSMQTTMLRQLSELFPQMQVFATTHSPLVALGASPDELIALKRVGRWVYSEEDIPDFSGYSAEDMLVDDRLFETSAYSPDTDDKLARYKELAQIPIAKRSKAQVARLRRLAKELIPENVPEIRDCALVEELRKFRQKYDL